MGERGEIRMNFIVLNAKKSLSFPFASFFNGAWPKSRKILAIFFPLVGGKSRVNLKAP